jgi:hypothetical protein
MASRSNLSKEEQKAIEMENHAANERRFNLVVKVITWKSVKIEGGNTVSKITPAEWKKYKAHYTEISKSSSEEKVKAKLDEIFHLIKDHGGFE